MRVFVSWMVWLVVAVFSSSTLWAAMPDREQEAYKKLAEGIPQTAPWAVMAYNIDKTVLALDGILKKYGKVDPTFRYEQVLMTLRGGMGYNPLDPNELRQMGFDLDRGVAAYSKTTEASPLIILTASDQVKVRQTLDFFAKNMARTQACQAEKTLNTTVQYFAVDCARKAETLTFAYAVSDSRIMLMADPQSETQFLDHVKGVINLQPAKSLAQDKNFAKLLGQLDPGTGFVTYQNYKEYIKNLKKTSKDLQSRFDISQYKDLGFLKDANHVLNFADNFEAQIFGLSITPKNVKFVHQLRGNPKKVKKVLNLFTVQGKPRLATMSMNPKAVGSLAYVFRSDTMLNELRKVSPGFKTAVDEWEAKFREALNIDLQKDILSAFTGEVLISYYGMNPPPQRILNGKGVSEGDLVSVQKVVMASAVKNKGKVSRLMDRLQSIKGIQATKPELPITLDEITVNGATFLVMTPKDPTLQFPITLGQQGDVFYLGVGEKAIETALAQRGKLVKGSDENLIAQLRFAFPSFILEMQKLNPPPTSSNTQLHQQYRIWKMQFEPFFRFMKDLEITTYREDWGTLTRGSLNY